MRTRRHSITLCVSKFKSDKRKQFFMLWIVNLWNSNSLTFSYLRSLDYLELGLTEWEQTQLRLLFWNRKVQWNNFTISRMLFRMLESICHLVSRAWSVLDIHKNLWHLLVFYDLSRSNYGVLLKSSPTVADLFSCPSQRIVASMPRFLWGL